MSLTRRVVFGLAVLTAMMGAACGDPPDREMQQAQAAIDTARAAGADQYAHDEFAAAQEALKRAADAVTQRDYRLALNNALDARERARTASKDAAARKTAARTSADRALATATAAVGDAHVRLKAAETAHAPARTLAPVRRTIGDADSTVQKARTAYEQGDFTLVVTRTKEIVERLHGATKDLDALATTPARRRH